MKAENNVEPDELFETFLDSTSGCGSCDILCVRHQLHDFLPFRNLDVAEWLEGTLEEPNVAGVLQLPWIGEPVWESNPGSCSHYARK